MLDSGIGSRPESTATPRITAKLKVLLCHFQPGLVVGSGPHESQTESTGKTWRTKPYQSSHHTFCWKLDRNADRVRNGWRLSGEEFASTRSRGCSGGRSAAAAVTPFTAETALARAALVVVLVVVVLVVSSTSLCFSSSSSSSSTFSCRFCSQEVVPCSSQISHRSTSSICRRESSCHAI